MLFYYSEKICLFSDGWSWRQNVRSKNRSLNVREYLLMIIGAVLVNNFVLSRILGICPFLGVSKRLETALGMGGAVI
ncbi:MAG: hypothetical protein J5743_05025, partial [Victivallales bacterium]|nr:hypothetical protein [Victivallales bacterium]